MPLPLEEVYIDELLQLARAQGWNELRLEIGKLPYGLARSNCKSSELSQYEAVRKNILRRMIYDILTDEEIEQLEKYGALQFSYCAQHIARFAVSVLVTNARMEASFRLMPRTLLKK
jgi:Tfp pilus assembly pilus retraction ATPase PilT